MQREALQGVVQLAAKMLSRRLVHFVLGRLTADVKTGILAALTTQLAACRTAPAKMAAPLLKKPSLHLLCHCVKVAVGSDRFAVAWPQEQSQPHPFDTMTKKHVDTTCLVVANASGHVTW